MMKKRILLIVLSVMISAKIVAQSHDMSHNYGPIAASYILQQSLNEPGMENKEVKMMIVDFPPKSLSSAHRHPCPTFGYMLEGEIESVFEGKTYIYKKGDSFYETTNGLHTLARNNDPLKPAKLLVFFIVDKGKPTGIPEKE